MTSKLTWRGRLHRGMRASREKRKNKIMDIRVFAKNDNAKQLILVIRYLNIYD
jgi:hypothetical protein